MSNNAFFSLIIDNLTMLELNFPIQTPEDAYIHLRMKPHYNIHDVLSEICRKNLYARFYETNRMKYPQQVYKLSNDKLSRRVKEKIDNHNGRRPLLLLRRQGMKKRDLKALSL
jgi:hypothetical protein